MAVPVGTLIARLARILGLTSLQIGIEKPEELVKIVLLVFFLLVAVIAVFFVMPFITVTSIPMADSVQIHYYIDAADKVNGRYGLNIEWEEVLALDAVLLEQDFSKAGRERAEETALLFVREETETYTVVVIDPVTGEMKEVQRERTVYRRKSLETVMRELNLDREQKEWVRHFYSLGLKSLIEQEQN
jgi:hypothetical protein